MLNHAAGQLASIATDLEDWIPKKYLNLASISY